MNSAQPRTLLDGPRRGRPYFHESGTAGHRDSSAAAPLTFAFRKFRQAPGQVFEGGRDQSANGGLPTPLKLHQPGFFKLVKMMRNRGSDLLRPRDVATHLARRRTLNPAIVPHRRPTATTARQELHNVQPRWVGQSLQRRTHRFAVHRNDCGTHFDEQRNVPLPRPNSTEKCIFVGKTRAGVR